MPTARSTLSGVASALFIALRIQAGLAANISPSSTNRIPRPMRKSANAMDLIGLEPPFIVYRRDFCPCPLVALRLRRRRGSGGIAEVAEEIGVRLEQEAGIAALQAVLIGRHRAVEREEVRILAIRLGKQPVALGVALATGLLGLRVRLGHDHRRLAVGVGTDFLRLLPALRAELGRFALALGLHALIDRLAVLLRQIGAADTYVDYLDAVAVGLLVELVADASHQRFALIAHHLDETDLAEHAAQRCVEQRGQLKIGGLDRADALIKAQRVLDAIAREGVDNEPLLVGVDPFLRRVLQIEDPFADRDPRVDDPRLAIQTWFGDPRL